MRSPFPVVPSAPRPRRHFPAARRAVAFAALAVALTGAGCLEGPASDSTGQSGSGLDYSIGGTFSRNATTEDVEAFQAHTRSSYGVDAAIMESFPLQFRVAPLTASECASMRTWAEARPYVASVGDCREIQDSADPDAATSSPT